MNRRGIVRASEKFAKKHLAKGDPGHDFWHAVRVRNNAEIINKEEKGDWFVIQLAALLHDVGDRKIMGTAEDDHSLTRKFLKKQKVTEDVFGAVMNIVENMSFSQSLSQKNLKKSIEFKVVQDADRLDSIGAIGIARCFSYGAKRGRPLYNPEKIANQISTTKKYVKMMSPSSLHHFDEKLFFLKDLMNTRTAKKIATKRHAYMKEYVIQFKKEWEGKK